MQVQFAGKKVYVFVHHNYGSLNALFGKHSEWLFDSGVSLTLQIDFETLIPFYEILTCVAYAILFRQPPRN